MMGNATPYGKTNCQVTWAKVSRESDPAVGTSKIRRPWMSLDTAAPQPSRRLSQSPGTNKFETTNMLPRSGACLSHWRECVCRQCGARIIAWPLRLGREQRALLVLLKV